jgi:hypothetical protein
MVLLGAIRDSGRNAPDRVGHAGRTKAMLTDRIIYLNKALELFK